MSNNLNGWLIKWKVCDQDGTLSLSNLLFMVLIAKLALASSLDWATMSVLFLAVMNHNARKWFAKARADKALTDQDQLQALSAEVKSLRAIASVTKLSV